MSQDMSHPQKKQKTQNTQGRSWCYTLNNPTPEEKAHVMGYTDCVVHYAGNEVGESGTPHIQGYIRFQTNQRLSALKDFLFRAHWEKRYGTERQAAEYAIKDGDVIIQHGRIHDGIKYASRNEETEAVMDAIQEGKSYTEIRNEHRAFCFWYRRQIFDFMQDERTIRQGKDPYDLQSEPQYKS